MKANVYNRLPSGIDLTLNAYAIATMQRKNCTFEEACKIVEQTKQEILRRKREGYAKLNFIG